MLEVQRLEIILNEVRNKLTGILHSSNINNFQTLVENGWAEEFETVSSLQSLKPFFNDPLKAIFAKLFLLKALCATEQSAPRTLTDGASWIERMKKNLGTQFTQLCSQPDQHITYNGKPTHTFEELEKLAQQRNGPRPFIDSPALMNQDTAYNCFKITCVIFVIHMSTRYLKLYPIDHRQYAIHAAIILAAIAFLGSEMHKRGPHLIYNLSEEAVQNNLKLQANFLISTDDVNQLKNQRNMLFIGAESLVIGAILQQLINGGITSNPNVIGLPLLIYGFATLLKIISPISALTYDRFFRSAPQAQPNNAAMELEILDAGDPRVRQSQAGKASKK